jgi:IclR family KDG regulon transcriptional repressor
VTAKLKSSGRNKQRIDTVDLVLALLSALATSQGVSVSELAATVAVDRDLVAEALDRFAERGFVFKDPLNLYWLGPQVAYIGGQASTRNALIYASSSIMDDLLCDTQQDSAVVVTREGLEIRHVMARGRSELLQLPPLVASRGPLHIGGTAKVMLAFAPREMIEEVIANNLDRFTPGTVRTRDAVHELLEKIRSDGFYLSIGESNLEVSTICAPVRDARGQVIAGLSLIGRAGDLDKNDTGSHIKRVIDSAAQISKRLG